MSTYRIFWLDISGHMHSASVIARSSAEAEYKFRIAPDIPFDVNFDEIIKVVAV